MTLLEFLEAREDAASPVAWLELAEYRDWVLYFASLEGRPVRPIVCQSRTDFERALLTTSVTVAAGDAGSGPGKPAFHIGARGTPLVAPGAQRGVVWEDFLKLLGPDRDPSVPMVSPPAPAPAPAPVAASAPPPAPDPVALYKQQLEDSMARHKEAMAAQQAQFDAWQAEHQRIQGAFDKQNQAWSDRFKK